MSRLSQIRSVSLGLWRVCIALVLVVLTSPICWLIDYDKLVNFVKRYGIDATALLSIVLGGWMYMDGHPARGLVFIMVCVSMSIVQYPDPYLE